MLAGESSVDITDTQITASSRLLLTSSPDPTGDISGYTVGSGTATVTASKAPTNDWTIRYIVV
jgi:hypothetical protein